MKANRIASENIAIFAFLVRYLDQIGQMLRRKVMSQDHLTDEWLSLSISGLSPASKREII